MPRVTTVEWIESHVACGGNEQIREGFETMLVCPCGATHVYSVESLLDDQAEAIGRAAHFSEELKDSARELQDFLDDLFTTEPKKKKRWKFL